LKIRIIAITAAIVAFGAVAAACDNTSDHTPRPAGGNIALDSPSPEPAPAPIADSVSTAQAVGVWASSGGAALSGALKNDLSAVQAASGSLDLEGTTNSCQALLADVHTAQMYDPIPDDETQAHWSAALDDFEASARDCIDGVAALDPDTINRAGDETIAGGNELEQASARLSEILGQ
jgi:hypothetical protein